MNVPVGEFQRLWWKFAKFLMLIFVNTSQFSFKFCINLECNQIELLCTFLALTLHNLVKSSPLKCKFLRLLSSQVKTRQIPCVNFETTSQSLFRFFIILACHYLERLSNFVAHAFSTLDKRIPWNINFDIFKCTHENLPNCSCHTPNHKSVFLQILNDSSVSWNILLCNVFRSDIVYFAQKGPIKVQIF